MSDCKESRSLAKRVTRSSGAFERIRVMKSSPRFPFHAMGAPSRARREFRRSKIMEEGIKEVRKYKIREEATRDASPKGVSLFSSSKRGGSIFPSFESSRLFLESTMPSIDGVAHVSSTIFVLSPVRRKSLRKERHGTSGVHLLA